MRELLAPYGSAAGELARRSPTTGTTFRANALSRPSAANASGLPAFADDPRSRSMRRRRARRLFGAGRADWIARAMQKLEQELQARSHGAATARRPFRVGAVRGSGGRPP